MHLLPYRISKRIPASAQVRIDGAEICHLAITCLTLFSQVL